MGVAQELEQLCRACGACCNGVMFAYVDVSVDRLRPSTRAQLTVSDPTERVSLPCPALGPTGCDVYDDRPSVCRSYTCLLFDEHASNPVELDRKLGRVARIRDLVASIRARRRNATKEWLPHAVAEVLAVGRPSDVEPELMLDLAELAMRLQRDMGWDPKPVEPGPEGDPP